MSTLREESISTIEKFDGDFECLQNETASRKGQVMDQIQDNDQEYCHIDDGGVLRRSRPESTCQVM